MVLLPDQYDAWLDGGSAALSLVGVHPDAGAFRVSVVQATPPPIKPMFFELGD